MLGCQPNGRKANSASLLRLAMQGVRDVVQKYADGSLPAPKVQDGQPIRVRALRYAPHFAIKLGRGGVAYTASDIARLTGNTLKPSGYANIWISTALNLLSALELGLINQAYINEALSGQLTIMAINNAVRSILGEAAKPSRKNEKRIAKRTARRVLLNAKPSAKLPHCISA